MTQFTDTIFQTIRSVFAGRSGEESWVDNDAALTPREVRVRRIATILQWGGLLNLVLLIVLGLILALDAVQAAGLSSVLLASLQATAEARVLLGLAGIGANASLLLLLAAGTGAQEFWAMILTILAVLVNGAALFAFGFFPAVLALIPLGIAIVLAVQDLGAYHANAVMVKELRGRMRGVRSFAIISVFLLLMGSFTILLYLFQLPLLEANETIITGELGRLLFVGVVGIELLLIVFIVPALTAGAITGERERRTYDLLQTTLLAAPSFIVGKMESALGYILLLLLSAIPLQSIAFLFGGISSTEVIISFVLLAATALGLGALGMYFSATTDRTLIATIRVYSVAAVLVFVVPLVSFLIFRGAMSSAILGVAVPADSPSSEAFLIYGDMVVSSLNPVASAFYSQQMLIDRQQVALMEVVLSDNSRIPVLAPWVLTTIVYVGLTAFLLLLAVRSMRRSR